MNTQIIEAASKIEENNGAARNGGAPRLIVAALAATVLFGSAGIAAAQERNPAGASDFFGLFSQAQPAASFSHTDHIRYDRSGTRGRLGLGASPAHPEGPGNDVD